MLGAVINSLRHELQDTGELPYRGSKPPCNGCKDSAAAGTAPRSSPAGQ
jgi:hypothetical protein